VRDASTEGMGAAGYYDAHSEYQRRVIEAGEGWIASLLAAVDLDSAGALTIADYGAGTGATSVHAMKSAIAAVRQRDLELPILAVHNDVPTSDFSQLFRNIAAPEGYLELGPVYPAAVAGSFFSQVLPPRTVHAGMCSNAAHWLREQPRVSTPHGMYFSEATGAARHELAEQAARDWVAFLTARAAELAEGGHLLVQGIGTTDGHVSAASLLQVMWEVAVGLADDGLLDRELLDLYIFPAYCRSVEEVTAPVLKRGPLHGILDVVDSGVDEVANPYWEAFERDGDAAAYAETYVEFVRAFAESTLLTHLFEPGAAGIEPQALSDAFYDRLREATAADPERSRYEAWIVRTLFVRREW
jgi:hypothetical protein